MNIFVFRFKIQFDSKVPVDFNSSLVQLMAWNQICDKPSPESMLTTAQTKSTA